MALAVNSVCVECGERVAGHSNRIVCSLECRKRRRARQAKEHEPYPSQINRKPIPWSVRKRGKTPKLRACVGCGINFETVQTRHESRVYCSFVCCNNAGRRVARERTYLRGLAQVTKDHNKASCLTCRQRFSVANGKQYCRREQCLKARALARHHRTWRSVSLRDYHCEDCGRPGVGTASRRVCDCCRRRRGLASSTEDRCRRYGVLFDRSVTRSKLLDRAGWLCQSCGIVVVDGGDWTDDDYANVDHVVPLSARIFGHTWENTQVLCRRCNATKAATMPSEFAESCPLWAEEVA